MKGFKTITYSNMAFIWAILLPLFAVVGQTESRSFVIDYEKTELMNILEISHYLLPGWKGRGNLFGGITEEGVSRR